MSPVAKPMRTSSRSVDAVVGLTARQVGHAANVTREMIAGWDGADDTAAGAGDSTSHVKLLCDVAKPKVTSPPDPAAGDRAFSAAVVGGHCSCPLTNDELVPLIALRGRAAADDDEAVDATEPGVGMGIEPRLGSDVRLRRRGDANM